MAIIHYNLGVKILNDKFGIQVRGGCSCAGTYGHYLLNVEPEHSNRITELINKGDYSEKPGWIRLSLHPIMTDSEIIFIAEAISALCKNYPEWVKEYTVEYACNHIKTMEAKDSEKIIERIDGWYDKIKLS